MVGKRYGRKRARAFTANIPRPSSCLDRERLKRKRRIALRHHASDQFADDRPELESVTAARRCDQDWAAAIEDEPFIRGARVETGFEGHRLRIERWKCSPHVAHQARAPRWVFLEGSRVCVRGHAGPVLGDFDTRSPAESGDAIPRDGASMDEGDHFLRCTEVEDLLARHAKRESDAERLDHIRYPRTGGNDAE